MYHFFRYYPNLIAITLFLVFAAWWLLFGVLGDPDNLPIQYFSGLYGLMALFGGIAGLFVARRWGGLQSVVGRAVTMLSLGLLAQEFGQLVFGFYLVRHAVEIPYPSLADIGFFGSIIFYLYGIWLLAKAAGAQIAIKAPGKRVQAFILPLLLLGGSYYLFLSGASIDLQQPLRTLLDFGYPSGQALYLSLAILTFTLSRKLLGGVMRGRIVFIVVAFLFQYLADFNFLYQASNQTWVNGGYGDFLYLVSYFMMSLALIQMMIVYTKVEK